MSSEDQNQKQPAGRKASAHERLVSVGDVNRVPSISDDVLRLHILYLEKLNFLSKGEREAFEQYLAYLGKPVITLCDGPEFGIPGLR